MAFRIHDSVVRGEIDSRVKGRVCGKIWLEGSPSPLTLHLAGYPHADLAGCLLTFSNPRNRLMDSRCDSLTRDQHGVVGDFTASRKSRVFDVSTEEAYQMLKAKGNPPEHLANVLYLEWFSETNGRVVIESADYELTISPRTWQLTSEENEQRARDAARAMDGFLQKLNEAIERHKRGQKDPEASWNEHDYERFLKEADARTEKYVELLDKYGDSEDAEAKISREMGWERELSDDEAKEERARIEEINRACEEALHEPPPQPDPHRESIDWIRTPDGDIRHPLQHRCFESAMNLWHQIETLGLKQLDDKDLADLVLEFQTTSVKLSSALHDLASGSKIRNALFTVAYLKRALAHLHKAQAGLEAVALKKLLPIGVQSEVRKEIFAIREGILRLMNELRGQANS